MRRILVLSLLILALTPGTWIYETGKPYDHRVAITFTPVPLPPKAELARRLGAFELEGIWSLTSPFTGFGGYSALLGLPDGRLMAISDDAQRMTFSPPDQPPTRPEAGVVLPNGGRSKLDLDTESATRDPATGTVWIGREYLNRISRHDPAFRHFVSVQPPGMRRWGNNTGAEAMVRLTDGRFIVLAEGFSGRFERRRHRALLFPGDPIVHADEAAGFIFGGAPEFSPTDMAQLPDGRVLVLMRRLVWPFPLRFSCRIMIADPAAIRPWQVWQGTEVAELASTLPVDNFEGMAIVPRADGRVTVWLISDNNDAATQRTLLWKLVVDPARLPGSER